MKQLQKLLKQFSETVQDLKIQINQLEHLFFLDQQVLEKHNWQKYLPNIYLIQPITLSGLI